MYYKAWTTHPQLLPLAMTSSNQPLLAKASQKVSKFWKRTLDVFRLLNHINDLKKRERLSDKGLTSIIATAH